MWEQHPAVFGARSPLLLIECPVRRRNAHSQSRDCFIQPAAAVRCGLGDRPGADGSCSASIVTSGWQQQCDF